MTHRAFDMHPSIMRLKPFGFGNSFSQPGALRVRLDCIMVMVCVIVRGGGRNIRQT